MNIQEYATATVTILQNNKNPSAISREIGVNQSTTSRFLKEVNLKDSDFLPFIKILFGNKKLNLVIDDFTISKRFSQEIEGVSSMVDQSTKTFTNGYKFVAAGITDGNYFLPIALEQWIAEFILKDDYLTIPELAKKIILYFKLLNIKINCFVLDGLYFTKELIDWLRSQRIKFVIKAKTTTSVIYKKQKVQLQNCKDLFLNSNQNYKKIFAEWNGKKYWFIAVRRTGKRGTKIIYLIANFKVKSKKYGRIYDSRWNIEKFIRTSKQSLGLNNSFSQQANIYTNHIKCVFYAYCLLQLQMKKFRLDSIEKAIQKTQALKFKYKFRDITQQFSLLESYA